jgi:peptidoglycan/xylan/chitin deacetylase (PgdA/CDA1 family)
MRGVAARLLAVGALAACFGWLLTADDSGLRLVSPVPAVQAAGTDEASTQPAREQFTTRRDVVPYGRATLELPILLYHYIRVPPPRTKDPIGYGLSVAAQAFAAQMDWLAEHDYHTVTFADLRLYWHRQAPLPGKPVIITLDDGYQDLYTSAFPILAAHGFTAVAYIVTGFVGERGYVTRDQILDMDRYGIEIGAHTVTHVDLARSSTPWMTYQVVQSKAWLEKVLGHAVPDMAYPSGKYDARTIAAVQKAGYYSAVTTQESLLHSQADRYVWGRVRVSAGESMGDFVKNLGPAMPTVTVAGTHVEPTPFSLQQRT